jgi:hypothetical protein
MRDNQRLLSAIKKDFTAYLDYPSLIVVSMACKAARRTLKPILFSEFVFFSEKVYACDTYDEIFVRPLLNTILNNTPNLVFLAQKAADLLVPTPWKKII